MIVCVSEHVQWRWALNDRLAPGCVDQVRRAEPEVLLRQPLGNVADTVVVRVELDLAREIEQQVVVCTAHNSAHAHGVSLRSADAAATLFDVGALVPQKCIHASPLNLE